MRPHESTDLSARMLDAIEELKSMIRLRYPDARFEVTTGEDPEGVRLIAEADIGSLFEIDDVVGERLEMLQDEEGLPLYVLPMRLFHRTIELMQSASSDHVSVA